MNDFEEGYPRRTGLPGKGIPLVGSEEMRDLERELCRRFNIDTLVLMENAGRNVARYISRLIAKTGTIRNVVVLCGSGNNGGDGLVAARHLRVDCPCLPLSVFLAGDPNHLKRDSRTNYLIAESLGIDMRILRSVDEVAIYSDTLVVDALFGTGVVRPVTGLYRELIEKTNQANGRVLALDVPSGIDASTGQVMGCAIRAHDTVTLGMVKRGLVIWPGLAYAGRIRRVSLGIPFEPQFTSYWPVVELITAEMVASFLPVRPAGLHKIAAGVVGVCAGSEGMLGAGILASQGAVYTGCGMVVWALPSRFASQIKPLFPELVSFWPEPGRGEESFYYRPSQAGFIADFLYRRKCSALVVGPGLGTHAATALFLNKLVNTAPCSGVLDADALTLIAQDREEWRGRLNGWVLTPHIGEMASLARCSTADVEANRLSVVQEAAAYYDATMVLKGPGTLVASPEGGVAVNPTGNPGLASAGSGDVLAGVVASLMAQGLAPNESARAGVFLHGLAGDLMARKGYSFFSAGEVAGYLREAVRETQNGEWTLSVVDGD